MWYQQIAEHFESSDEARFLTEGHSRAVQQAVADLIQKKGLTLEQTLAQLRVGILVRSGDQRDAERTAPES
ncbi:hypothetical protein AN218_14780 [Streptomyces nanshensis]|uniref:Uncharacterized protein n=1 Tax=Streptomyces nanshensis TaxID=518642 RepID=A0A1E7L4J8_9ACTN|nr:hypothetical protein AN218_14780 [Streptomyces nanshensis]